MKTINKISAIGLLVLLMLAGANMAQTSPRIDMFKKSVAFEKAGDYNEAIKIMTEQYSSVKKDYLFNLRLGWLYYLKGDFKTSQKYYKEAVRLSNKSVEALLGLTYPLAKMNNRKELKNAYETILDKDPANYKANYYLGLIYFNDGDYLNAILYFEKVVKNYPSDYNGNLYLGWANYYVGANKKAHHYFENALIAVPNDPSAVKGFKATEK